MFVKGWPTDKELEMLPSSWISVDEGMDSKVRRNCNVRVVSCGKPNPLQQEGLEDRPFTNPVRCKMVRGGNNSMSEECLLLLLPLCQT